jgi:hypothetical protein
MCRMLALSVSVRLGKADCSHLAPRIGHPSNITFCVPGEGYAASELSPQPVSPTRISVDITPSKTTL